MKPKPLPVLETDRLVLRLAAEGDVPAIVRYYDENRDYLQPFEPLRPPGFFTPSFWYGQVQRNIEEFRTGASLRLFSFVKAAPADVAGYMSFTNITRGAAHFCFLGYSLAEKCQGHGYMTESLRRAIWYVFTEMHIHRVMANYMPHNVRSGRLLRRLGFVPEGYARDYLLINGRWEDHVLTSLTNPSWVPPDPQ
ncbi:ribosomal protein S5-alanine N-acetyltransferase [Candidatus Poribacteria bacterium]|nr:ribosomal protein S5-alanine N-acetyltransferase [Candidatus Poribacteria bacterium]